MRLLFRPLLHTVSKEFDEEEIEGVNSADNGGEEDYYSVQKAHKLSVPLNPKRNLKPALEALLAGKDCTSDEDDVEGVGDGVFPSKASRHMKREEKDSYLLEQCIAGNKNLNTLLKSNELDADTKKIIRRIVDKKEQIFFVESWKSGSLRPWDTQVSRGIRNDYRRKNVKLRRKFIEKLRENPPNQEEADELRQQVSDLSDEMNKVFPLYQQYTHELRGYRVNFWPEKLDQLGLKPTDVGYPWKAFPYDADSDAFKENRAFLNHHCTLFSSKCFFFTTSIVNF